MATLMLIRAITRTGDIKWARYLRFASFSTTHTISGNAIQFALSFPAIYSTLPSIRLWEGMVVRTQLGVEKLVNGFEVELGSNGGV